MYMMEIFNLCFLFTLLTKIWNININIQPTLFGLVQICLYSHMFSSPQLKNRKIVFIVEPQSLTIHSPVIWSKTSAESSPLPSIWILALRQLICDKLYRFLVGLANPYSPDPHHGLTVDCRASHVCSGGCWILYSLNMMTCLQGIVDSFWGGNANFSSRLAILTKETKLL